MIAVWKVTARRISRQTKCSCATAWPTLERLDFPSQPLYSHPLTERSQELHAAVEDCSSSFKEALGEQLYETFDRLVPVASDSAVATAT